MMKPADRMMADGRAIERFKEFEERKAARKPKGAHAKKIRIR